MVIVPKRITLVPQVAEVLRRGIRNREWIERMPAEGALAVQLQVSRMTLRAGMKILAAEKRIRISAGRRAVILSGRSGSARTRRGLLVGILLPIELSLPPFGVYYSAYCDILHEAGLKTRYFTGLRFYQRNPTRPLEELLREAKADFWVITMSTGGMQQWFSRRNIPVMIDGSCQAGIALPALDVNYRAVCRHAVGVLLALGHRRITFLAVRSRAGGDAAGEMGFAEAFPANAAFKTDPRIVYVEVSAPAISDVLARLFRGEKAPTALLCERVEIATTAMSYLSNNGFRLPRDVSLICRDSLPYMDYVVPSVARYSFRADTYARRLARMTIKHFESTLNPEQQFILPGFFRGDSVGPAPSSA